MKIRCGSIDCKWCDDDNFCTYEGTILLNDCYVSTVNEGRQHFHYCKRYEKDDHFEQLEEAFKKFIEGHRL